MISADEWPLSFSVKKDAARDPVRGAIQVQAVGTTRTDIYSLKEMNFAKTNYLVLTSRAAGRSMAYQAWKVVGTTPDSSNAASSLYVRNGSNVNTSGPIDIFTPYSKVQGGGKYEPRLIGRRYGTQKDAFIADVMTSLNAQGIMNTDVVINYLIAEKPEFFQTGTLESLTELINQGGIPGIPTKDQTIIAETTLPSDAADTGTTTGSGSGGNRPPRNKKNNGPAEQPTLPAPVIKIVTRMPRGYAGRGAAASVRPQMVQRYTKPATVDAPAVNLDDVFTFRYIPQGIKYSGLASEWTEIPRAEDIPFVDWARWQLMKVSFSFIIANDRTEQGGRTVPDGLESSVDSQIEQLRRMAQRKSPVMLFNFDDMLSFQLRRSAANRTSPNMEFVINDLSITATRRTTDPTDGTPTTPSQIAVAQVEITLTEIPVEVVGIVALPPINSPYLLPPPPTRGKNPNQLEYGLITDGYSNQPSDASTTVGGQP